MSILFWSVESSIGRFREKGKELVIQEKQYKIFYFKYKKVKSLKVSTFNENKLDGQIPDLQTDGQTYWKNNG